MLKSSSLLLTALIFACFLCAQKRNFKIIGSVAGFQDGTYITLYDYSTGSNVFMDSAKITHNKFVLKGTINNVYQSVGLVVEHTMVDHNIKVFWIEGGDIHFTAEKDKFNNAIITGSPMQTESEQLLALEQKDPKNEKQIDIAYIKSHPNSLISGNILAVYCTTWGKDTAQLLYNGLSEKVKQSEFGQKIQNYISLARDIKVGDKYADFTLPTIDGKNVSLSDYNNKYVLLDFWGSWCGPCREENVNLVKTYQEFKDKGFDILGVSIETNKKGWLEALTTDKIAWQCVSDLNGFNNKVLLMYGISYYPASFLIAPNGTIIAKDLRGEELRKKLSELLP